MLYQVEVMSQGNPIATHTIEAPDALTAMNMAEISYGEPASSEFVSIEDAHARKRIVMLVHNWHGYTFSARAITPPNPTRKENHGS